MQQSIDFFNSVVGVCWPPDGDTNEAVDEPDADQDAGDDQEDAAPEERPAAAAEAADRTASMAYRPASYLSRKEWHLSIGQVIIISLTNEQQELTWKLFDFCWILTILKRKIFLKSTILKAC